MTEQIFGVTEKNFEAEILQSDKPVMVDFWAPWCTQCKALDPLIAQLADAYSGQVGFGKCNLAEHTAIAVKYGIRSVPFFLFFKNGNVTEQRHGFQITVGKRTEKTDRLSSGSGHRQKFSVVLHK